MLVEETLSKTHSSQQAPLFPLLVNSPCVLAGSGTLLTESLPKLSLSSVQLTAHLAEHLHTHIKTLHRLKQGGVDDSGWPNCSLKTVQSKKRQYLAAENYGSTE